MSIKDFAVKKFRSPVKRYTMLFILAGMLMFQSCSTYRIVAKNDPAHVKPHSKTMWTFAWGLVQPKDYRICSDPYKGESGAIDQVHVKTNLGYILLSAATVGAVVPLKVECYCAKVNYKIGTTGDTGGN